MKREKFVNIIIALIKTNLFTFLPKENIPGLFLIPPSNDMAQSGIKGSHCIMSALVLYDFNHEISPQKRVSLRP